MVYKASIKPCLEGGLWRHEGLLTPLAGVCFAKTREALKTSTEAIHVTMDQPYPKQPGLHVDAPHRAALLTFPGNLKAALQESLEDPQKTMIGVAHGIPSVYLTKVVFRLAHHECLFIDPGFFSVDFGLN